MMKKLEWAFSDSSDEDFRNNSVSDESAGLCEKSQKTGAHNPAGPLTPCGFLWVRRGPEGWISSISVRL